MFLFSPKIYNQNYLIVLRVEKFPVETQICCAIRCFHFLDFKMPLIYFEIANAGKYITKYKGEIGAILILDSIEYFFGVDDLLISYEEE